MKIGLYGGIANNIYVFAKALAAQNIDISFIRDRSDTHPFSQPVWEDVEFRLPYEEIQQTAAWTWDRWSKFEQKLDWRPPTWLLDPLQSQSDNHDLPLQRNPVDGYWLKRYLAAPHRSATLQLMKNADALLVCGTEGSILAHLSGKPYVIWPHGGDMMIAAGLLQPGWSQIRRRIAHGAIRRQLISAFSNAICIGNHEPTGITSDYYGAEHYLRTQKITFMPIPIPVRPRASPIERRKSLEELLGTFGHRISENTIVGFVPSRLDYEWKGHDRLLQALAKLQNLGWAKQLYLVFSGWGKDFNIARSYAAKNGIASRIVFLDSALSKPLLFRFYLSADFVIDQFVNGMYGTSALEAMACGAPLLTWLNDAYDRPWGKPPVIQARTAEEITSALLKITQGSIDLEDTGRQLQQWIGRVHNPVSVTTELSARFRDA